MFHFISTLRTIHFESPVFDELLYNLAYGEEQKGAALGTIRHPLIIGWGRRDRVTLPNQSKLALQKFPDAQLYWFNCCAHFPQSGRPAEAARLILDGTSQNEIAETISTTEVIKNEYIY